MIIKIQRRTSLEKWELHSTVSGSQDDLRLGKGEQKPLLCGGIQRLCWPLVASEYEQKRNWNSYFLPPSEIRSHPWTTTNKRKQLKLFTTPNLIYYSLSYTILFCCQKNLPLRIWHGSELFIKLMRRFRACEKPTTPSILQARALLHLIIRLLGSSQLEEFPSNTKWR